MINWSAALVGRPHLPSTQLPHILYLLCISFKECSPTSSNGKCCLHIMVAKDACIYSYMPTWYSCLCLQLFISSPTCIIWRALVYVCYPSYSFTSQSSMCDLKNLTPYFNTKEINISTPTQQVLFIGAYHVCLALLHADFIHKKATECNKNLESPYPWEQMTYFPLYQKYLRQIVNIDSPAKVHLVQLYIQKSQICCGGCYTLQLPLGYNNNL